MKRYRKISCFKNVDDHDKYSSVVVDLFMYAFLSPFTICFFLMFTDGSLLFILQTFANWFGLKKLTVPL